MCRKRKIRATIVLPHKQTHPFCEAATSILLARINGQENVTTGQCTFVGQHNFFKRKTLKFAPASHHTLEQNIGHSPKSLPRKGPARKFWQGMTFFFNSKFLSIV
ncbi:hypothetical protein O6H91_04G078200 [Diphasiastrum complanatum]|uniref:Uncharacterized protein n=1 Tax=Diphasiastrum complanatum TaxID=34168 RepID=A0ACC2DYP9_DIPCM|nr:hypothetical protein O6H91_04G078200 [Diphasiastrum complanatum]